VKASLHISKSGPEQMPRGGVLQRLRKRYDQLWSDALGRIRMGEIEVDPILKAGMPDQRRGLTVIARPSAAIRQRVAVFLRKLRTLEPAQYYYAASEFHLGRSQSGPSALSKTIGT
jgi:hypothetical protein